MPAIVLAVFRAVAAIWSLLVRLLPFLGRIGPWLLSLFPNLMRYLQRNLGAIAADSAEIVVRTGVAVAFRVALMVFWGVFLVVLFTGINGLGLRAIFISNPFSGFPTAMMLLVVAAFPVKFAFALVQSYIVFKFTLGHAALVCARCSKFCFGT